VQRVIVDLLTLGDTNTPALDTTSLNEESARRRHPFLTAETVIASAGFEAAFPSIERPPTYAFDRAATEIWWIFFL
jgi:hypothetical protein